MKVVPRVFFFVFSFLSASGLAVPAVEHTTDQAASTVSDTNITTISILKGTHNAHEHTSTVKKTNSLTDRLLNRIKEGSVLKRISNYKKPIYIFHNTNLANHFISLPGHNVSRGTLSCHEKYNSKQQLHDKSIMGLVIKPAPKIIKNMNLMTTVVKTDKINEFISTYYPVKILANGTDLEIVRNTILRFNSLHNDNDTKTYNNTLHEKDGSHITKGIHLVRKYFNKIPNVKVNEHEERSKN